MSVFPACAYEGFNIYLPHLPPAASREMCIQPRLMEGGVASHPYQIASLVVESLLLEAKLGESPAYLLGTELLGDAIADDLEGSGCRHEYTALILGGFAEVYIYQFSLQSGCLKLAVVLVELLYLSLGKPVLIAALV